MADLVKLLEVAERSCLQEYEHRQASFVWASTAAQWKGKAEGIRYAIDTIIGLAQEAQPAPADSFNAKCGRCGHFWDWHGKRDNGACKGGYPVGMTVSPCNCREKQSDAGAA